MSAKQIKVSANLSLPDDVVTMAIAALGIRGSGKTNTGVVIAEGLLDAGHQVIIVDPLDVWWGLKSSADGKSDGYPITVLGGNHGDLPLAEGDGKTVADFLIDNTVPAILALRRLSKAAQRRFVADFAEHFYHRKGEAGKNTPVMCIIDEASLFVPQHFTGDSARMVGAIESWVRQGRVAGIGAMLIDQRAASVNKDVLSQVELMIAHRHTSPQDRKALQIWVQAHATPEEEKEFMASLASLSKGESWFWSPEWLKLFERVKVRLRHTFDSSATPHGGKPVATPKKLAPVELTKLREKLAATIEKAKADDPKELKRQIIQLKTDLSRAGQQKPAPAAKTKTIEKPVITDAQLARLEKLYDRAEARIQPAVEKIADIINPLMALLHDERAEIGKLLSAARSVRQMPIVTPSTPPTITRPTAVARPAPVISHKREKSHDAGDSSNGDSTLPALKSGAKKIAIVLCQWHPTRLARDILRFRAGFATGSGTFTDYMSALRRHGMLDEQPDGIGATEATFQFAQDDKGNIPKRPSNPAEYLETAMNMDFVKSGAKPIGEYLIANAGRVIPRHELREQSGFAEGSGTFTDYLSQMRRAGIAIDAKGGMMANPAMFEEVHTR